MKTIRFLRVALLIVLLCVGFSSCSKSDDDNGASLSNPLVGTWRAEYDERGELRYCEFTFNANLRLPSMQIFHGQLWIIEKTRKNPAILMKAGHIQ